MLKTLGQATRGGIGGHLEIGCRCWALTLAGLAWAVGCGDTRGAERTPSAQPNQWPVVLGSIVCGNDVYRRRARVVMRASLRVLAPTGRVHVLGVRQAGRPPPQEGRRG